MSEYDNTMLKLAKMASEEIAREKKISKLQAFLSFMKSKTGEMLFEKSTDMWMNGPDYIADEYKREMYYKRYRKPM
ncbi:MAG: hypothetical protein ACI4EX_03370 [Lachnospiraceae bacterium]